MKFLIYNIFGVWLLGFIFISPIIAQTKLSVGIIASPSLESLYEGRNINNVYVQKFVTNLGVIANFNISKRIDGSAGVIHYFKGGQMSFVDTIGFHETGDIGKSKLRSNIIGIPIIVDLHFWVKHRSKFRKMKIYKGSRRDVKPLIMSLSGGIIAGFAYKQEIDNRLIDSDTEIPNNQLVYDKFDMVNNISNFQKVYLAWTLGLKVTYNFSRSFSLVFRPAYTKQLNKVSKSESIQAKLFSGSIDVGLFYTIR